MEGVVLLFFSNSGTTGRAADHAPSGMHGRHYRRTSGAQG